MFLPVVTLFQGEQLNLYCATWSHNSLGPFGVSWPFMSSRSNLKLAITVCWPHIRKWTGLNFYQVVPILTETTKHYLRLLNRILLDSCSLRFKIPTAMYSTETLLSLSRKQLLLLSPLRLLRPAVMLGSLHFHAHNLKLKALGILGQNLVNAASLAEWNDQSVFRGRNMPCVSRSCWKLSDLTAWTIKFAVQFKLNHRKSSVFWIVLLQVSFIH